MLGLEKIFSKLNAQEAVATYLIVGLGNPGQEYRNNRHNVGFMVIDRLGQEWGLRLSKLQCKALIGMGSVLGHRVILAKPQTFMNLSGDSVVPLARFYKIPPERVIVLHEYSLEPHAVSRFAMLPNSVRHVLLGVLPYGAP